LVERPLVLIKDGRITAVESGDLDPPPDAEVVDLGEVTLLPGLIDTHVHLGFDASVAPVAHLQAASDDALLQQMRANAATALAAGITTVRDLDDQFQGVGPARRASPTGGGCPRSACLPRGAGGSRGR
jgi:imidazolonepropionase-like amidohydrolase